MKGPDVVVVDYGMGNLLSVRRGLEFCGATVEVTGDPAAILAAPRVLLPGVGAFANGMGELRRAGLDQVVHEVAGQGTPLLGICLGMQLLFDDSEEFGATRGLGLIPGRVVALPTRTRENKAQKVPHIGWNALLPSDRGGSWDGTLLENLVPGHAAYFVHSFMASPNDAALRLADCQYGGAPVSAVVVSGNVAGCQFHPEKSGEVGLKVLRRFLAQ
ncbi:MAG TPA: imidazole glycerol phosphate synthase subunit HisH [Gemmatimonadaceae bacterium]|nr:imidazole glycerol phosphate synthase subunit HisH [Gemmatimonadaceae bacterium]